MIDSDYNMIMRKNRGGIKMLTIQQAAYEVLKEAGEPLKSIEIAKRILDKGLIESSAKNPIQSISQALERNIRMNKGNSPKLEFVDTYLGRHIQSAEGFYKLEKAENQPLSSFEYKPSFNNEEITISLPKTIVDKAKIFQLATGASTLDDAIAALLKSGLASNSEKLIEVIKRDMENL